MQLIRQHQYKLGWNGLLPLHHNAKRTTQICAQKYEFVIRTWNSESMLNGTGDVRREFMCSERLKDEVEQLL